MPELLIAAGLFLVGLALGGRLEARHPRQLERAADAIFGKAPDDFVS